MSTQTKIDPTLNPSLYSYGSNNLSSKSIFEERIKYDYYVFPDFLANNFVKTWTQDRYYGTINHNGNAVLPNIRRLKRLSFTDDGVGSLYALDFVADAWYDFSRKIKELANNNVIYRDSPWAKPYAVKAWTPISDFYDSYMRENVFPVFNSLFMGTNNNNEKVKNISDFMKLFSNFMRDVMLKSGPVTLSALVESQKTPVYASGLVIEISLDEYDDDFNKAYNFGDANFSLIANIAAQYGFLVDKNIPWRFVADLRNPAMQEYMTGVPIVGFDIEDTVNYVCDPLVGDVELPPMAYGYSQIPGLEGVLRHISFFKYTDSNGDQKIEPGYRRYQEYMSDVWVPIFEPSSQESIFRAMYEQDYTETWSSDMQILEDYILDFYNFYVSLKPSVLVQEPASLSSGCPPVSRTIERNTISEEEFRRMYSYRWRLKTIYTIRRLERQVRLPESRKKYELRQIMNVYNLTKSENPLDAYYLALQVMQEDYIGPTDVDPLTMDTVGDIIHSD